MRNIWVVLLFSFFSLDVFAQQKSQSAIEDLIQTVVENAGSDFDFTDLFQKLEYWQRHPLDLQTASREDLKQIPLLSEIQITQFIAHRARYGNFLSIYELQSIDGWDLKTAQLLSPFCTVLGNTSSNSEIDDKHDLMIRAKMVFPQSFGFTDTSSKAYLGSPVGSFIRYKYAYGKKFSFGLVAENDPGESFRFDSAQLGADFTSAHFQYFGNKWVKKIIVGDYNAQFGQGLSIWTGVAFGKSPFVLNILRQGRGIVPYTSANESQYLRGAAVVLQAPRRPIELSLFASHKNADANLKDNVDTTIFGEDLVVSGLNLSGYHRTLSELSNRHSLQTTQLGGHVQYQLQSGIIGATALYSQFSSPFVRSNSWYDQYDFQGKSILNVGIDHKFSVRNALIWGELSRGDSGLGIVEGMLLPLDARFTFTALYRNFSPNFHSLYGSAIAENTQPNNERGIYLGIQAIPRKKWTVSAYLDRFYFPWWKFGVNGPSGGWESLVTIEYTPSRRSSIYLRGKYRLKQENSAISMAPMAPLVDYSRYGIRMNARFATGPAITWQTRIEWSGYQKEITIENGFALMQDFAYKKVGSPVAVNVRWAWFNTPSFNTAIYAYESDLLYYFSVPGLYGNGNRMYAMIKWDIAKNMELSSKIGVMRSIGKTELGSGNDLILGDKKLDWRIQCRMLF